MTSFTKQGGYFYSPALKSDFISGFMVFLLALPLCLGIAKASGFPLLAGIITASIGGIIVGIMAGSPLTIKGPAAGLISIAAGAVLELGKGDALQGYKLTLAVIVMASLIQIIFGLVKAGKYGDFFPTSAVHGMLAAIGFIIISKQIHKLFGMSATGKEPFEMLAEIPHSIMNMNPQIAIVGLSCLTILFVWPMLPFAFVKKIPGNLVALFLGVGLGFYYDLFNPHLYQAMGKTFEVGPKFLVTIDKPLLESFTFPDFSQVFSGASMKYAIMFAMVGTIESMLTVKAIDKLNPRGEVSNINRDILAVGIGNVISGLLGGLPMIAEVGRSSANLANGARSRWGNMSHGIFIFGFVALFPNLLHFVPEAALAAMLVFTGYKLCSFKNFKHIQSIGYEQLFIFTSTIIVTLATDLLIGIGFGIVIKFIVQLFNGCSIKSAFWLHAEVNTGDSHNSILVKNAATFSNYLGFKKIIHALPEHKNLVIDFSSCNYVDHTFMEHLQHWCKKYKQMGLSVSITGLEHHIPQSKHLLAARKVAKPTDTRIFENPVLV